uniref:Reverse transcriptase domain-containing protein n=1 Tax=Seriola dumerili TaxID=41447 RepID=A0A3B4TAQ9_SERDU
MLFIITTQLGKMGGSLLTNPSSNDIRAFLSSLSLPTLIEEQRDLLDAPITVEEVVGVIGSLPSGKSPGLDGFTAKFYKCYATELAPLLSNEAFETSCLPPTLMESVITVVLKSGKNPTDKTNKKYRPISLLGYDEKVLSKLLSLRVNKVITSLVAKLT